MKSLNEYQFIDIHYHADPDLYHRRYTAFEAGRHYQDMNALMVLKSHLGSTSIQASLCQHEGLPVLPSLVLNSIAGGIDFRVILRSLAEYRPLITAKMIVHFPTQTGRAYQSRLQRQLVSPNLQQETMKPETLFDDRLRLRPAVIDILKLSHDYPIVLSTGHASREEIFELINACIQHRVPALLLNQPAHPLVNFKAEDLNSLSKHEFLWFEQTALTYLIHHQSKEDMIKVLSTTPNLIYSSDLGQKEQMDINNWPTYTKKLFLEANLSVERQRAVCLQNAACMLTSH